MLSEKEIEQIKVDAEKKYPYCFDEGEQGHWAEERERKAYISGRTEEREAAKSMAIGFVKWLGENYDFNEFTNQWGKFWEDEGNDGFDEIEINELYENYLIKTTIP